MGVLKMVGEVKDNAVKDNAVLFHNSLYIINAHVDAPLRLIDEELNYLCRNTIWHTDLPRIREGGVDVLVFAIYSDPKYPFNQMLERANRMLDIVRKLINSTPEMELILTSDDFARIKAAGKVGIIIGLEGADPIHDTKTLYEFFHAGVRLVGLTWNYGNKIADGFKVKNPQGLTPFGIECIRIMNELGIIIDLSHIAEPGFWDVIKYSNAPIIASHSNARSITDHPRNLTDNQLNAIKEKDGVVGLCYEPWFLREGGQNASLRDILQHYFYIKDLIGDDHIGLGTDFDGIKKAPKDMEDVSKTLNLTRELLALGVSHTQISLLMGENFLRVFNKIFKNR